VILCWILSLLSGAGYITLSLLQLMPPLIKQGPWGIKGPLAGDLFGLLATNLYLAILHLLIGTIALASSKSYKTSQNFCLYGGLFLAALFIFGQANQRIPTLGGYLPLDLSQDALHLLSSTLLLSAYIVNKAMGANNLEQDIAIRHD